MGITYCRLGYLISTIYMMMKPSWHISIDSIVLDTSHGLVELLTTMIELNKYAFDPFLVFYIKLDLKDFVLIPL
jgi:hypothetical protein